MRHNQEMLENRAAEWGDKVRIVGLSIDEKPETVAKHVEERGWTSVQHYHIGDPENPASDLYGIEGVPHVLLVNKVGTIVFVGHPAETDIEDAID